MHRTQVLIEDHQYQRLRSLSADSGRSIGELVRRAIETAYGGPGPEALRRSLHASHGAWADREIDGADYVESIRPGLGARATKWE